ncbi:MAG: hypothetical protein ABF811_07740 [Pseudoclavibacter sp.]
MPWYVMLILSLGGVFIATGVAMTLDEEPPRTRQERRDRVSGLVFCLVAAIVLGIAAVNLLL